MKKIKEILICIITAEIIVTIILSLIYLIKVIATKLI